MLTAGDGAATDCVSILNLAACRVGNGSVTSSALSTHYLALLVGSHLMAREHSNLINGLIIVAALALTAAIRNVCAFRHVVADRLIVA